MLYPWILSDDLRVFSGMTSWPFFGESSGYCCGMLCLTLCCASMDWLRLRYGTATDLHFSTLYSSYSRMFKLLSFWDVCRRIQGLWNRFLCHLGIPLMDVAMAEKLTESTLTCCPQCHLPDLIRNLLLAQRFGSDSSLAWQRFPKRQNEKEERPCGFISGPKMKRNMLKRTKEAQHWSMSPPT